MTPTPTPEVMTFTEGLKAFKEGSMAFHWDQRVPSHQRVTLSCTKTDGVLLKLVHKTLSRLRITLKLHLN